MDTPQAVLLTVGFILATLPIFLYQNYVTLKKRYEELEKRYGEEHERRLSLEEKVGIGGLENKATGKEHGSLVDVLKTVNDNQKRVLELLAAAPGNHLKQIDLFHETGIPKSTLSYEVKALEQRNIVEVRNAGRTNLVELRDWLKTVE